MTEPNSSQVDFGVPKCLEVDKKGMPIDRRKGNKERSYAEVVAWRKKYTVHGGKNTTSEQSPLIPHLP